MDICSVNILLYDALAAQQPFIGLQIRVNLVSMPWTQRAHLNVQIEPLILLLDLDALPAEESRLEQRVVLGDLGDVC